MPSLPVDFPNSVSRFAIWRVVYVPGAQLARVARYETTDELSLQFLLKSRIAYSICSYYNPSVEEEIFETHSGRSIVVRMKIYSKKQSMFLRIEVFRPLCLGSVSSILKVDSSQVGTAEIGI